MDDLQKGWQCPVCESIISPATVICVICSENTNCDHEYEFFNAWRIRRKCRKCPKIIHDDALLEGLYL